MVLAATAVHGQKGGMGDDRSLPGMMGSQQGSQMMGRRFLLCQ